MKNNGPNGNRSDKKPILIGYLPPLGGIEKSRHNYEYHKHLINIGDIVYTYAGSLLCAGKNFIAWDWTTTAKEVNEKFSHVIFIIPCRIAPPPYDSDGFPYELVTKFIEELNIPFTSIAESVQSTGYEYSQSVADNLSAKVRKYLHTIAERSNIVGTRGEFSADVLKSIGISNVEPVGCTSMYINGPRLPEKLLTMPGINEVKNIAVGYSNYQNNTHSRIKDVLALASEKGCHYVEQSFNLFVKALHYPGMIEVEDISNAKACFHGLDELLELFESQRVHYFTNYKLWREFLTKMDFVFGARMHGLTPALQSGIPALFIAHDARVREMCEFFHLPFIAEQDLPSRERLTIDYLYSQASYGQASKTYQQNYSKFINFLRANNINPNIDEDGNIIENWEAEPLPSVISSETRMLKSQEVKLFRELCEIQTSDHQDPVFLEKKIKAIGQKIYLSRG